MVESTVVTGCFDGQEYSVNQLHICAFVTKETHAETDTVTNTDTRWFTPFGSLPEA